jgi:hypothetical protein
VTSSLPATADPDRADAGPTIHRRRDLAVPTTIVGSFPQPDWLIDREKLAGRFPPRVRARELWRVAEPYLQ